MIGGARTAAPLLHNAARHYCQSRLDEAGRVEAPKEVARMMRLYEQDGRYPGGRARWEARTRAELRLATGDDWGAPDALARLRHLADAPVEPRFAGVAVLAAVLEEVERSAPADFSEPEEARAELLRAGSAARLRGGLAPDPAWHAAMDRERRAYLAFVARLTPADAARAPALPFRRVLGDDDRRRVRARLRERWDARPGDDYWWPLRLDPAPPDVLALQQDWFYAELGVQALRELLVRRGIGRVWEIGEIADEPEHEMDPRLCEFTYTGPERYWSSPELDWLVYVSHESSITFAGAWLAAAVKAAWPNWERRVYTDYDYT